MGFTRLLTLVVTVASLLRFDQVIAAHTNSSLRVRQNTAVPVYNTCTVPRSFALTFDMGLYGYSEKLDEQMPKEASLSMGKTGDAFMTPPTNCLQDSTRGILSGAILGSHVHLNQGTYDQIDVTRIAGTAMIKILGVKPLYMRPPYGEYNDVVKRVFLRKALSPSHKTQLQVLRNRGYKGLVMWSQDSGDTHIPAPSSSPVIRSYRSYPEKTIVLNHEVKDFTVEEVIPAVIPILQRKGFSLQTVPECLGLSSDPADWYVRVQEAGTRDDSWTARVLRYPASSNRKVTCLSLKDFEAICLLHCSSSFISTKRNKSLGFQSQEGMGFTRLLTLVVTVASLLRFDQVTGAHTNDIRTLRARQDTAVPVYDTCTVPGSFALTFDDGPYGFSTRLDSTLNAANAKGSFFINGQNWGCIYDYADVLLERFNNGHFIASHTWSHVHMNQGTYEQLSHQLELVEQAMIRILGVKPLYMRPPYGEYNDVVLQVLRDRGYKGLIMWNQDSGDTFTPTPSSAQIIDSYRSFPEKTISLNHEIKDFTVDQVIPAVIPILQQKGFSLQTVPEALGLSSDPADWYVRVQEPGTRDDSWTCEATPLPGNFE
ncbi:hypothetical protein PSHT_01202 [Puccinia striiformis]|uniref:NodB homology domain-containing protein n=1 Tax=Puccinia striiformis TaxID=27350 RepID=A0A2S4WL56_9BASI|nr:hypothetical protein PSHT_01202 [Puccinia striiformis]